MIRTLRWEDMNDIVSNYYSFYDELKDDPDFGIIFYPTKPDYESEIAWFAGLYRDMLLGDVVAVVAEEDGRVVGLCDVHRTRPKSELSHVGVLGITIRKEYRDRGIGTAMIEKALELSRDKFEIVRLDVFTVNSRAIALYRKLGFVEYGIFPASVKRGSRYYDQMMMYYKF